MLKRGNVGVETKSTYRYSACHRGHSIMSHDDLGEVMARRKKWGGELMLARVQPILGRNCVRSSMGSLTPESYLVHLGPSPCHC